MKQMVRKIRHILRDFFVWVVSCLGLAAWYRARRKSAGPLVRVIAFHDVPDRAWFERVVARLIDKYNVISPDAFVTRDYDTDRINVLLTFDDGYRSWVDVVLPVLETYRVRGLFFVTSGLLDVAGNESQETEFMRERLYLSHKPALDSAGLRALHSAGHTIGGHTVSHPNLGVIDRQSVEREVIENKRHLEGEIGTTIEHFAYPFGRVEHMSEEADAVIRAAGYRYIYEAETGFTTEQSMQKRIPRTLVEKNQRRSHITRWIGGGYDIFNALT